MTGRKRGLRRQASAAAACRFASRIAVLVLALAQGCASAPKPPPTPPPDLVILLPDEKGNTGAIVVSGAGKERVLSKPWEAVNVPPGAPPEAPFLLAGDDARSAVGRAILALPLPPLRFTLNFNNDTSDFTKESKAEFRNLFAAVKERRPIEIVVDGHTDTVGSKEHNDRLSRRRAEAVAALLAAEGLDPAIVRISSHGESLLLVPTGDEVPEPRNRRVEVTVR
jgi:outer membrane protein OmpA-like peptidoglycan-associated protein